MQPRKHFEDMVYRLCDILLNLNASFSSQAKHIQPYILVETSKSFDSGIFCPVYRYEQQSVYPVHAVDRLFGGMVIATFNWYLGYVG